jgi:hypothetical protein
MNEAFDFGMDSEFCIAELMRHPEKSVVTNHQKMIRDSK